MRYPAIKQGRCFTATNNYIKVFAYETNDYGKVTTASVFTVHVTEPLVRLRDKYAAKLNIFPHEIELENHRFIDESIFCLYSMFYENKEVFDDDTCSDMGIEHEHLVKMQVTMDTINTKMRNFVSDDNWH
uniref:Uncharacterized protein n=1 Tax=Caenorhabditis japonica TaxID=281687 RepID=A0A8R1HNY1_CAEJA